MIVERQKKLIHPQDTLLVRQKADTLSFSLQPDSLTQQEEQDTVRKAEASDTLTAKKYSPDEIQSIFERSDQRFERIDSAEKEKSQIVRAAPLRTETSETVFRPDSNHIIFSVDSTEALANPNFLSNLTVTPLTEYKYTPDLFVNETSAVVEKQPDQFFPTIKQPPTSENWIIGIILVSFIILAWIRLFYNKLLVPTFQSCLNYQTSYNLFRDRSSLSLKASFGLNIIFYLNTGLFLYLVFNYFGITFFNVYGIITFLLYAGFLMTVYIAKWIVCSVTGYISLTQKAFSEYLFNVFLFNRNLGLFLFPFLIGIPYIADYLTPIFVYAGIVVIVILYLLRIFRGITIFFKEGFSIFYMILYLCALEFLPLILFFRLFQSFI